MKKSILLAVCCLLMVVVFLASASPSRKAMCQSTVTGICFNQAVQGSAYCSVHQPMQPPVTCKCTYTLSTGQQCGMSCYTKGPILPAPKCIAHTPLQEPRFTIKQHHPRRLNQLRTLFLC